MPELTCEQVNERIAKALGWTCRKVKMMYGGFAEADGPVAEEDVWFRPDGEMSVSYKCPDYCHDLNACAEAERIIIADDPKMRAAYLRAIVATLGIEAVSDVNSYRRALLTASPETRARALVQTLEETALKEPQ